MPQRQITIVPKGLRPETWNGRNTQFFTTCRNLRTTETGLQRFFALTAPYTDSYLTSTLGESKTWPWPQVFKGRNQSYLCFSDAVYKATEASGNWTATSLSLYDASDLTGGIVGSLTGGGAWQFVDFGGTVVLLNGVDTIMVVPGLNGGFSTDDVTIKAGANWNDGRVVLGGFNASNIYSLANWPVEWATYDDNLPAEVTSLISGATAPGGNWVWFSSIGGGDLLHLFDVDAMKYGSRAASPGYGFSEDDPYYLQLRKMNLAGWIPMPWGGDVLGLRQIGRHMLVLGGMNSSYRSGGLTALTSHSGKVGISDIAGFGTGNGVFSRSMHAGDGVECIFADEAGELWRVDANLQAERLGHREFISGLTGTPVMSFDEISREYYISDADTCYLLNQHGISEAPFCPTNVFTHRGVRKSIYFDAAAPTAVTLVSDTLSPSDGTNLETLKSVTVVGLNDATDYWSVAVDYRLSRASTWTRTSAVATDGIGYAQTNVTGLEFRIVLTAPDRTKVTCERIECVLDNGVFSTTHWLAASAPAAATE